MKEKKLILKENIKLVSEIDNRVSYKIDEGLQFGIGFFETILIRDKAYFLKEHLERINKSLDEFEFNTYLDYDNVEKFIYNCGLKNIALKLIVTEKNTLAMIRKIPYVKSDYKLGKKVTFSKIIKSKYSSLIMHKTLNYGENILELRKAKKMGYDDCIFINENGYITESAVANLFMVKNNRIITPPISDGLLPGVIRRKIMENFNVCEEHITKEQLMKCEGAFLTNSLFGVMKISEVENTKLPCHEILNDIGDLFKNMFPKI